MSVVIPSARDAADIAGCLASLADQDLSSAQFEVIVVINGTSPATFEHVQQYRSVYPDLRLKLIYQERGSAGAARNTGIAAARHQYLTFVDDDDRVGPRFLSTLMSRAAVDTVVIAPIINVDPSGGEDANNPLNLQITARAARPFPLVSAVTLLGFNACKLIPTAVARQHRYAEHLRSGEDICYMAAVALSREFTGVVGDIASESAYFRQLSAGSVSRQHQDFDFAVRQRLDVIIDLEQRRTWTGAGADAMLLSLIRAQVGFIRRFLQANPGERRHVVDAVVATGIRDFPWGEVNAGLAKHLAISYCFVPFEDTSATVAAKAIAERGRVVDVILNDMSSVRRTDPSLRTIAGRYIATETVIDAPASFAGWPAIRQFVEKGLAEANRLASKAGGYETLYSRVLWAGSHFLAGLFKAEHPDVVWTAEFSDPLSFGADGAPRPGTMPKDVLRKRFSSAIKAAGFTPPREDSLFTWCEYLAYALADELIFTNENQLDFMVSYIEDPSLRTRVRERAVVRPHPTPPAHGYTVTESSYVLSPRVVNIGYFGAFYDNRGLGEVLTALANSSASVRRHTRLHVFSKQPDQLRTAAAAMGIDDVVISNSYRPYLEFLNLCRRFDVLLVNDVTTGAELPINPFLPSKYSDYAGSGRPVWGLVDEGSPLSRKPLAFRSESGNAVAARAVLAEITRSFLAGELRHAEDPAGDGTDHDGHSGLLVSTAGP
ncbi:hypothetical protein BKD30_08130 [Tersicoccus phoenicis]|uniref:Glycosyltransferase 2-like domain-containing protein n=1 Tax=Tersicoccus phoenicis TaxID=554083 RepID=A0A1R1LAK9_9MICC|nr:hypothetical protein BKD30_08130 [Tersicoccus phoenicis]